MEEPREEPGSQTKRLTKAELRWIIGGILAILFGIFVAENTKPVEIHFVFFTATVRLIWLFPICALIGAVVDRLLQRRGLLPTMRPRQRKRDAQRRDEPKT